MGGGAGFRLGKSISGSGDGERDGIAGAAGFFAGFRFGSSGSSGSGGVAASRFRLDAAGLRLVASEAIDSSVGRLARLKSNRL